MIDRIRQLRAELAIVKEHLRKGITDHDRFFAPRPC